MEKRISHYSLEKLKKLFKDQNARIITSTAFTNAVSLGYMMEEEIVAVVEDLGNRHFYKAMTTYQDSKMWQDVYKITDDRDNKIYVKLQLSVDKKRAVLIQFKEDTGDKT